MTERHEGFAGRIYVVTGSTQGVGAATAEALAKAGAGGLVICGRNRDAGKAVLERLKVIGTPVEFVAADLANEADCQAVIAACDRRFGRIDGLVNAAGDTSRGTLDDTTTEAWDRQFAVNVRAPFFLMRDTIRLMKRDKVQGAIVNVLTLSALGGQPYIVAYSASKGALLTLTKNVANTVRFDRIKVNGFNLGWTETPNEVQARIKSGWAEDWVKKAAAEQPFGRLFQPEDAAKMCLFLLGPDSGVMTGSVVDFAQRVMGAWD